MFNTFCLKKAVLVLLLAVFSSVSHAQFVPDDPYFFSGSTGDITNPDYYGQWHLLNQMPISSSNAGLDVNVWGAWQRGLTGNGVVIGIIDDGTQGDHPDLIDNFRNDYSWDFSRTVSQNNGDAFRGSPMLADDNHGTSVAGVAAARGGNGIGLTGAAPFAGVAAQRFLVNSYAGGVSSNQAEAWAIGFQGQKNGNDEFDPSVAFTGPVAPVRVMNHSYGPDAGYQKGQDWEMVSAALAASAENKVIHVYAAGNQREEWTTQDSNTILSNTSPNAIVVAALGSDGKYASYSSFGANVLVTAPSSSFDPAGSFAISTTDRSGTTGYNTGDGPDPYFAPSGTGDLNNYTSTFGGTSSATPLVSGIMALGIEANSNMDVRMARHLIAQTSRKIDAADSGWITNAAGYHFNQSYGFGLIDADAFTLAATQVVSMTEATIYAEPTQMLTDQNFGSGSLILTQDYFVDQTAPLPLEYVQLNITLSGLQSDMTDYDNGIGAILGDISGTLLSPSGTLYSLFSDDRNLIGSFDDNRAIDDLLDWTFTSYAYFGEEINGNWTISLLDGSTNTDFASFGSWDSYQLIFGTGAIAMVPEPSSILLVTLGAGFFAMRRSRIRAKLA